MELFICPHCNKEKADIEFKGFLTKGTHKICKECSYARVHKYNARQFVKQGREFYKKKYTTISDESRKRGKINNNKKKG